VGRDWNLRDGDLVLPPGTHAPVEDSTDLITIDGPDEPGVIQHGRNPIRIAKGTWYHKRQIEVTYEPAKRDWSFLPPVSSLDDLPRVKQLLTSSQPVSLVLFGNSIATGGNASKYIGIWPYQPSFGELVARKLEAFYGSCVTFMNHSRGGGTASYAVSQAVSQVGWFKPDLVIIGFGMNDRPANRRIHYRENMETIIDTIRTVSPKTEFIIVTPIVNNPDQSMGLDPVKYIRDQGLAIDQPGVAHVDMTTPHLQMLRRKSYLDLTGNGVNHPDDFLHRMYAQRILEVLLPRGDFPR